MSDPDEHFFIGDVHGQLDKLVALLRSAGLVNESYDWSGAGTNLWFLGDYFDRGPAGLDVVDLIIHLQSQAPAAGGSVHSLLGNHDVQILSARNFNGSDEGGREFVQNWVDNGGIAEDLRGLTQAQTEWLTSLPALAVVGNKLIAHADSDFYLGYGDTIDSINRTVRDILTSREPPAWRRLIVNFADRHVFDKQKPGGAKRAARFLEVFRASQLIHGHTPIDKVTGLDPAGVKEAYVYADGLCVNIDGGMYRGGPGFILRETL